MNKKQENNEKNKSEKLKIVGLFVLFLCLLVLLFCVTYAIVSKNLDKKIEDMGMSDTNIAELDTHIVKEVIVYYNGDKYDNLDDLVDVVHSGDKVYCTVTYDDEVTRNKTVYVSVNLDEEETHVRYIDKGDYDGKYGQLLLPVTMRGKKDISTLEQVEESATEQVNVNETEME